MSHCEDSYTTFPLRIHPLIKRTVHDMKHIHEKHPSRIQSTTSTNLRRTSLPSLLSFHTILQGSTCYCIAHGGGRRCTFPGCGKGARDKFFCAGHGGGKVRVLLLSIPTSTFCIILIHYQLYSSCSLTCTLNLHSQLLHHDANTHSLPLFAAMCIFRLYEIRCGWVQVLHWSRWRQKMQNRRVRKECTVKHTALRETRGWSQVHS